MLSEYELTTAAIYIVYPHRRHLSAKIRSFVDYMVAWFERAEKNGQTAECG